MSISNPVDAVAVGKIIMNTVICIASCGLTGLLFQRFVIERSANGWSYHSALAGSFTGMVRLLFIHGNIKQIVDL